MLQGLVAFSTLALTGCDAAGFGRGPRGPDPGTRGRAALLLPLTGPQEGLGQILREAASLGGTTVGQAAEIEVLDAGGDAESAVRAARAAVEAGATMLIGPLFAAQARAVVDAVPKSVPVVTLSNDDTLAQAGAFVYGVTPLHSARTVFAFAAARGLTDIAVAVPPDAFGTRAAEAAQAAAADAGVQLRPVVTATDGGALAATLGADPPQAVYLPAAGPELQGFARAARTAGAQVLGSAQWSSLDAETLRGVDGAWYAAPDPLRFAPFSQTLADRGVEAGIVAGLVFDGVEMARLLGRLGQQDRRGLLRDKGFNGVLGPYRFRPDGRTERGLAVLGIDGGQVSVLGTPAV